MSGRRVRLELTEAQDASALETIAALVRGDAEGSAEFGGFYGDAPTRLAPLLGRDRRVWLLSVDGTPAGFVDAEHEDGTVSLTYFVVASQRRRGVARGAVGRLLGMAPWPEATTYAAAIDPANVASAGVARAAGFHCTGRNDSGDDVWQRPAPRRRGSADDITRFLDASGRIDRYPVRDHDRRALLAWVAERALDRHEVLGEREVNVRLDPFAPGGDVAALRRYLVDHGLLERTRSGSEYARVNASDPAH